MMDNNKLLEMYDGVEKQWHIARHMCYEELTGEHRPDVLKEYEARKQHLADTLESIAREYLDSEEVFEVVGDRDDLVFVVKYDNKEDERGFCPLIYIDYYHNIEHKADATMSMYYYLKWKKGGLSK